MAERLDVGRRTSSALVSSETEQMALKTGDRARPRDGDRALH